MEVYARNTPRLNHPDMTTVCQSYRWVMPRRRLLRHPSYQVPAKRSLNRLLNSATGQAMNSNDLDDIFAFLAVFEARSFTRAAQTVSRDPSVISRRISALEARLGVRLLERSTRHLSPTEAGEIYYRRMRSVVAAIAEAETAAAEAGAAVTGVLRLALPSTFGRRWITPLLPQFMKAVPGITIECQCSDAHVNLVEERFDVAIRVGHLADNRLVARRLSSCQRILVASPDYLARHGMPACPDDLARHDCLANSRFQAHLNWHLENNGDVRSVWVRSVLTSDESDTLLAAAVAGIGIMVSATWLCAEEIAAGRLVHVLPGWHFGTCGSIYLVRPSARYTPAKTRIFADWICARFSPPPWTLPSPVDSCI